MRKLILVTALSICSVVSSFAQNDISEHFVRSWRILRQDNSMPLSVAAEELSSSWGNWSMRDFGAIPRISSEDIDKTSYRLNSRIWRSSYENLAISIELLGEQNEGSIDYERNRAFIHFVMGYTYGIIANFYGQGYIYEFEDLSPNYELQSHEDILELGKRHFSLAKEISGNANFTLPYSWINGNVISSEYFINVINTYEARLMMNSSRGENDVDWAGVIELLDNGINEDLAVKGDGGFNWWARLLIQGQDAGWARVSQRVVNMMANESTKSEGGVYPYPDGVTALPEIVSDDARFNEYFQYTSGVVFSTSRGYHYFSNYRFRRYEEFRIGFTSNIPEIDLLEKNLLLAEAYLNVGMQTEALDIINRSRENGELPALTSSISTNDLFAHLQYEKTLASFGHDMAYFDKRRWGTLYSGTFLELPIPSENGSPTRVEISRPYNGVENFPIDGVIEVAVYDRFNITPSHSIEVNSVEFELVDSNKETHKFNVPIELVYSSSDNSQKGSFVLSDYVDIESEQNYSLTAKINNPFDNSDVLSETFELKIANLKSLNFWSDYESNDPFLNLSSESVPEKSFEDTDRIVNVYKELITEFDKSADEWRVIADNLEVSFSNFDAAYGGGVLFMPSIVSLRNTDDHVITSSGKVLFYNFEENQWIVKEDTPLDQLEIVTCYSCIDANENGVFYVYPQDGMNVVNRIGTGESEITTLYSEPNSNGSSGHLSSVEVSSNSIFIGGRSKLLKIEFDELFEQQQSVVDLYEKFISQIETDGIGNDSLRSVYLSGTLGISSGVFSSYSPDGNQLYMTHQFNNLAPSHFYFNGLEWEMLFEGKHWTRDLDAWVGYEGNAFVSTDDITASNMHWFVDGVQQSMGKLAPGDIIGISDERLIFENEIFNFSDISPELTDLVLSGEPLVGEELVATYTYTDFNGDTEEGTTIEWLRSTSQAGADMVVIEESSSLKYTLTDDDFGMFVAVRITPKNTLANGESVTSDYIGVIKKAQIITFAELSDKVYGDIPFELEASSDAGTTISFESSDPSIASVSGTTVNIITSGEVDIVAKQGGNDLYLEAEDVVRTLQIDKAALSITADNKDKVYGESNPSFTVTYDGFVNDDDESSITEPTVSSSASESSDVGEYTISLSGGEASNYAISLNDGTLTVAKAALTVTADDQSRVYGEENPELTLTYDGFVSGDDASSITAPSVSTEATEESGVGEYQIILSDGEATNYSFSLNNGMLTVAKAVLIASANDQSRAYGEENPELTITYEGFVNEDDVSSITAPSISTDATEASGVGEYEISLNGGSATNYSVNIEDGILTVIPAALTATAEDATINKGDAIPDFSISYSGFVNDEDESAFITAPTVSTTASASSERGSYDIIVSGGEADNYIFTVVGGTLTITGPVYSLPSTIAFDDLVLGDTQSEEITIENTGDGALNVTGIALPAGYVVDQSTFNVEAGANGLFTVTFTPIADQSYNGDIAITSNNGEETISITGSGQIVTGVDDEQLDIDEVGLFPNPADQSLVIDLTESPAPFANLSLVDLKGNIAWAKEGVSRGEERVNLSTFSSGIYLLFVETNKGTVIKKVIVRH